jgi:hypothetical protein
VQCPPDTYKNDVGVWPCSTCLPETNNDSDSQSVANSARKTCPQCTAEAHCPLQCVNLFDLSADVDQTFRYPETPDIDVFDDILFYHIFRTDCPLNSPLYLSLLALSIVLIISAIISVMKLWKRFNPQRHNTMKLATHLDLIGSGELWFGGLVSIVLLFLVVFASKFSHTYHNQYPAEKPYFNDKSCQANHLRNAKFETSLQFVNFPSGENEDIFSLLNSQVLNLKIELINTVLHCGLLLLQNDRTENSIFDRLSFSCFKNNHTVYVSAQLPSHNLNLIFALMSNDTVEGVRIGLTSPPSNVTNSWTQELEFSKSFYQTNQILSQNPLINLQLTKVINITEGLTSADDTTYSGLWLPTFTFNVDQLFKNESVAARKAETTLLLSISETPFFIRNKQQPIARRSEILFHTLLFVGVCIDFTAMMFLLLKLWFIPLLKVCVRKLFRPTNWMYRLIFEKKATIDVVSEIKKLADELEKVKRENQQMSAKINALLEHQSPPPIHQEIRY